MSTGFYQVPTAVNEPVYAYGPGSPEKAALKQAISHLKNQQWDVPMVIGGKEIFTDKKVEMRPPHELSHSLGHFNEGSEQHVKDAIQAALDAKPAWENMAWEHRASIFLKMADLLSGPNRYVANAATMLAQSKNAMQSEIDAVAELCDFLRFNVEFATELYSEQPISDPGIWNRSEYRPLEGFIAAITPFNFTSIAANLPLAAALMGNTVVWKPSDQQIFSAHFLMDLFREAGLPDGVVNMVFGDGPMVGDILFNHPDFAGVHFTGSTPTFQHMWRTIGGNIANYKSYPRIVGETGGKDFVVAHKSADAKAVATALSRGAFEFQGQKCSAASRAYIPDNIWPEVKQALVADVNDFKMGTVEDFSNFVNAVIDERSFDKIAGYIDHIKSSADAEIIAGGGYDKSKGYFIEPTVAVVSDPKFRTMCEEIFGPVLTIYVFKAEQFEQTLEILDQTSPYALTGAIFSQDRYAIEFATNKLRHSAGNFYINDKPTGAVVGQQPFGGGRASGTNDKAGSKMNLLRWVSARTIKENFVSPKDYRYPFVMEA